MVSMSSGKCPADFHLGKSTVLFKTLCQNNVPVAAGQRLHYFFEK